MNTVFLPLAEFERQDIPLEIVAERYLGLGVPEAKAKAHRGDLPFPAFRAGRKSPWLVHVQVLADWLDTEREKASADWRARRVPT